MNLKLQGRILLMIAKFPLFLLTMGVGYFVALKATEELGFMKHVGNIIATLMIVGSLLGMGLSGYFCYKSCKASGQCPLQKMMQAESSN